MITAALFAVGVVLNCAGIVLHIGEWPAAAFIAVNLVWLVAEAPITFGKPGARPREVATLIGYGVVRMSTVAAAVLAPWPGLSPWTAIPVLVFAAGVALRMIAMRTLGRFYSHHVIRRDDHAIVTSGPYRIVRHPAYVGMFAAHVGLVLFFPSWLGTVALGALAFMLAWRIRVEERELLVLPAYRDYATTTPRLVPGLW
jgi:protein-S-isoprenylcysteine O-methyltransferase Ste14